MKLTPGARVSDKIVLRRPLGAGAMGQVWVAHHAGLDTEVAVKFLFADLAKTSPTLLKRFRAEASVAAKIKSPYVVQMLDYGITEDGRPYLVMELLEGEALDHRLERLGPVSVAEMAIILDHITTALTKTHGLGVVHRDLKPANLFNVAGAGELFIKVLDFGIAKQRRAGPDESLTSAWDIAGTPAYMSPEQLASTKNVDARTDVWALGVITYELLTGQLPFDGNGVNELFDQVRSGRFTPATQLRPDLPDAIDGWLACALATQLRERFESAELMATAFRDLVLATHDSEHPAEETTKEMPKLSRPRHTAAAVTEVIDASEPPPAGPGQRTGARKRSRAAIALISVGGLAATAAAAVGAYATMRDEKLEARAAPSSEPSAAPAPAELETIEPRQLPAASLVPTALSPAPQAAPPAPRPALPHIARPAPPPAVTVAEPKKPNCEGENAYMVDSKGHLVPRPGCL